MKKFLILFFTLMIMAIPVFASVSSPITSDLGSDVFKPTLNVLKIGRVILVILIIFTVIITGIKYASSSGDRRSEYLKNGIIVAVVLAVLYFIAFPITKVLGITDVTISESAVILKDTLELYSGQ